MPVSARTVKFLSAAVMILQFFYASASDGRDSLQSALRRDVEFLSDSLCEGRKTGSAGASEAAFYIIRRLNGMGYSCSLQTFRTASDAIGRNIVAVSGTLAPELGSGKAVLGRPAVLLMAYYDGLGSIGDKFYPCADANASGVAALLSVAERLKGRGDVIIAFVDAHNANLAGAEALAASLSRQPLKLVANFDILGSTLAPPDKYWKDYLIILGGERYSRAFTNLNYGIDLHLYYDYYGSRGFTDLFYRKVSDHKVFLGRGVPVLMFTSGITMSTNRESDTFNSLDYTVMAGRVELIGKWLEGFR